MEMKLEVPNTSIVLYPGSKIRINRFATTIWTVNFGWYSFDGNRPICCWYLTSPGTSHEQSKPLLLTDLDDVYAVEL